MRLQTIYYKLFQTFKTKKHKEADYAYNKFEIEKYEPPTKKKNTDFIILK